MDVELGRRTGADARRHRPWLPDAAAAAITTVIVVAFGVFRLDFRHLHLPVYFTGDENLMLEYIKNALQNGPVSNDPQLGYPGHVNLASFPVFDTLSILVVKAISLFTTDVIVGSNLLAYADHALSGLVGYACFRVLRVRPVPAAACAVAFAWSEFGLNPGRVIAHESLQLYAPVAVGATLALFPAVRPAALAARSAWGLALAGAFVVGLSQPYWVAFSLLAIVPAGLGYATAGRWRAAALLAACAATMALTAAICVLWPRLLYGPGISIERFAVEQGLYGLRLGDMLTPARSHLPWLNAVHDRYLAVRGDAAEGVDAFVGWPGLIGLGIAALVLIRLPFRRAAGASGLALASLLIVVLVGFSLRHGFGEIFNRVVTPYIRAQNRVSPMVVFLAVFVFAEAARRLGARVAPLRRACAAAVPVVVAVGLYDQSAGVSFAQVQADTRARGLWSQAAADAGAVTAALPPGSAVLQLPFMNFPESPKLGELGSYDEINLALFTKGYRYSFGSAAAPDFIAPASIVSTAIRAASVGFDEVLFYRAGYAEGLAEVAEPLRTVLKLNANVDTPGLLGFDLRPLRAGLPPLAPAVLELRTAWGAGFSQLEGTPGDAFRWDDSPDGEGRIRIDNPSTVPVAVRFCGTLVPGMPGSYEATVDAAGQVTRVPVDADGAAVDVTFDAPPGPSTLSVSVPAPQITYAPGDPRQMHFQLRNGSIVPAAVSDRARDTAKRLGVPHVEACG